MAKANIKLKEARIPDEELDALVKRAGDAPLDDKDNCFICYEAAITITTIRAQLAAYEALRAEVAELEKEIGRLRMAVLYPAPKESEALRAEVERLRHEIEEATDPNFIWGAMDNVHDAETTLDEYADAVSRAQRAVLARVKGGE